MKVIIAKIPEHGIPYNFLKNAPWIRPLVEDALAQENPDGDSIAGNLLVEKVVANVQFSGSLTVLLQPQCYRCTHSYVYKLEVPLTMYLSPKPNSMTSKSQNVFLNDEEDDLDFSYHNGFEINISEILREKMVLALPHVFLCSDECRGLCPSCGTNFNTDSCVCQPEPEDDSRWALLKKVKIKQ